VSRSTRFGWYERAAKKPPPERGIRMKKAGTTWWGQRWLEALENVLRGDAGRLARGRTYARAGRTHDLVVEGGRVTAKVMGSRDTPYDVTIELGEIGDSAWKKAIDGMAGKAQFSAELLAGEMPKAIDDVFRDAGVSLFPKQREDLKASCSCPDWGDPCKHAAATHYVLGEALDRDPFLLFELRGRTKQQVLEALRRARGGRRTTSKTGRKPPGPRPDATLDVPTVKLGTLKADDYDKPREPVPSLHFSFEEPVTHGAVLRQLGAPAAWEGDASPADVLAPLLHAAAETARRIAMAEPRDAGEPPPPEPQRPRHKAAKARGRLAPRGPGSRR
jgi:uncharacterized Zn finger protein